MNSASRRRPHGRPACGFRARANASTTVRPPCRPAPMRSAQPSRTSLTIPNVMAKEGTLLPALAPATPRTRPRLRTRPGPERRGKGTWAGLGSPGRHCPAPSRTRGNDITLSDTEGRRERTPTRLRGNRLGDARPRWRAVMNVLVQMGVRGRAVPACRCGPSAAGRSARTHVRLRRPAGSACRRVPA